MKEEDTKPDKQNINSITLKQDPAKGISSWCKRQWKFVIEPAHSNGIIAIFTVALFLATISYTLFAGLQWRVTREALHADQRAWVIVRAKLPNLEPQKPIVWPVWIAVAGKTPAINLEVKFRVQAVNSQEVPEFTYEPSLTTSGSVPLCRPQDNPEQLGPSLLKKIEGMDRSESVLLSQNLMDLSTAGEVVWLLHGKITYRDTDNRKHWLTYCHYAANAPQIGSSPTFRLQQENASTIITWIIINFF